MSHTITKKYINSENLYKYIIYNSNVIKYEKLERLCLYHNRNKNQMQQRTIVIIISVLLYIIINTDGSPTHDIYFIYM